MLSVMEIHIIVKFAYNNAECNVVPGINYEYIYSIPAKNGVT